ncbi:putative leucine-rich repeat-containing protein DDB_G0290503 isoform X2 [Harmonia axyridis]|uniref:putative leucine-rich repeat-containing protein DDB_G0290503 isoform X2 n=1 Tax=Harmonia axyridis TaxID=115357 RepID=UPI001E276345|nr:putative leucine-rich repeat-containing protein DDB_G0290503 isoform X2 [Harmonia axyridis]
MEEETPPSLPGDAAASPSITTTPPEDEPTETTSTNTDLNTTKLSNSSEEEPYTVHPFDLSSITVIENTLANPAASKSVSCEGSDSGVEVFENSDNFAFRRTLSSNSGVSNDFENVQSCDSSISYCSNFEEAFNILVRRNSSLFGDCTLRNGDRTSDNGSESSSITGSSSSKNSKRNQIVKKRVTVEAKPKPTSPKERTRSKPPVTPKSQTSSARLKSLDRLQGKTQTTTKTNCLRSKQVPNNLEVSRKESHKRPATARTPSSTRTPIATPTDDGRWPSIHSRPAPLLSKTAKASMEPPPKRSVSETKTIEKYATLPRRKKEKSADDIEKPKKITDKELFTNRATPGKKAVPRESLSMRISTLGRRKKIKIYQENSIQTALTMEDIDKALSGQTVRPTSPEDKEFVEHGIQVDMSLNEVESLKEQLRILTEKHETLTTDYKTQGGKLREVEEKWRAEIVEKEGLQQELKANTDRILSILGDQNTNDENSSDSLMVLECRYQDVRSLVIDQEKEISRLNALCRSLQINLDQCMMNQHTLIQQHQELEAESMELQEFMQAEKSTLADSLREAESEIRKLKALINEKDKGLLEKQEESKHLVRLSEKRRQENLGLQAKLGAMEAKCRDLLVQQGSSVSRAAIAVSALSNRLDSLANELIACYNISEQDLEDVIFHNEVYNYSSNDTTPERGRKSFSDASPSSIKGSSFVSAVINAIRNNAPFSRDLSRSNLQTETSSSNEMLDSETEPCLMMEHVLEDVVVPDGHSHNMISSTHSMMNTRLTHSESLKDLSQAILNREKSEQANSLSLSFTGEFGGEDTFPVPLIDQVIDVDNSITRLLKVIKIVQVDAEERMTDLEDQKDCYSEQIEKQKETNKFVVKQLKDWELLGARLKAEVKDLKGKVSEKDSELEKFKLELNKQREQLEQNQDVCELSTALSQLQLEAKTNQEEVNEAVLLWERTGEIPPQEIMGRIISKCPDLKELIDNEHQSEELKKESANRQVLIERIRDAFAETKKQYEAIDNALEVLHDVQSVVQQCPPLAKLQRDLEEVSFQSASKMPLVPPADLNANAALLHQVIKNLEIASPINTTA